MTKIKVNQLCTPHNYIGHDIAMECTPLHSAHNTRPHRSREVYQIWIYMSMYICMYSYNAILTNIHNYAELYTCVCTLWEGIYTQYVGERI